MKSEFSIAIQKFISTFTKVSDDLKAQEKKVLITTHRFLDGDAFGSAVAFGLLLQKLGIESTLFCVPFVPLKLTFLGSMGTLHIVSPFYAGDGNTRNAFTNTLFEHFSEIKEDFGALVVLDCAGIDQIPEEAWSIGKDLPYKINIDHHAGYELQSPCGRILNLVLDCSSTSEIIFGLLKEMGIKEYPEIAVPLFVGMVADLRKNDVTRDSPDFPVGAIHELEIQARKIDFDVRKLVKTVFSLDPWEKYLLKVTLAGRRSVGDVVYVRFDHEMILQAKEATDSKENPSGASG